MACTSPSTLISATSSATEVDFMDSNNIDNAFYVKKVGTIDCTKSVGNLVWTVPIETKPGVYALQLLLTPNNAYSGRFNVTSAGGSGGGGSSGSGGSGSGGSVGKDSAGSMNLAFGSVAKVVVAAATMIDSKKKLNHYTKF
ncbi:hypothetical protein BGZ65_012492 [Modicella reniformis]|uniref:Uncharacterized protein n=1 Tax=Modicella reniformis TaxID=1440133 RepID=A0A9P6IQ77_9FUNG|nr:hypothetical protein BGZ65_012492 [Modicella reniformis]